MKMLQIEFVNERFTFTRDDLLRLIDAALDNDQQFFVNLLEVVENLQEENENIEIPEQSH